MKRTCIGLAAALAFVVFGTTTALAQQPTPDAKVSPDNNKKRYEVTLIDVDLPDEHEEVEILRRLLDKSFTAVYGRMSAPIGPAYSGGTGAGMPGMGAMMGGSPGGGFSMAWEPIASERSARDLQGVYLKDYGVVYTVTLPPPPGNMLPGSTVGVVTRTPLSPWERTRKELRGEKIEDESKPLSGSPSLSEVILKVLADNGRHVTRLAEGERLTVAVTFQNDAADGIFHPQNTLQPAWQHLPSNYYRYQPEEGKPTGTTPPAGGISGSGMNPLQSGGLPAGGSSAPGSSGPPAASQDEAPWLTDVRNDILLGDLHVKQQKHQEANVAYQAAVDKLDKELAQNFQSGMVLTQSEVPGLLTGVNLYNKLAQVYAKLGNPAAAREMLQKASALTKKADDALLGGAAAANPPPSSPALPSKLIVTASKKLLDEIGSGKTSFEAFCKAATVEHVKPSADKK